MTEREPCSCQFFTPFGGVLIIFEYFTSPVVLLTKCHLYKQKIRVLSQLPLILDINRITMTSVVVIMIIICI